MPHPVYIINLICVDYNDERRIIFTYTLREFNTIASRYLRLLYLFSQRPSERTIYVVTLFIIKILIHIFIYYKFGVLTAWHSYLAIKHDIG